MIAVLLGANHDLVAPQAAHVEQRGIRNPEAGVEHELDQILQVLARPGARALIILVLAADFAGDAIALVNRARWLVTGRTDPRDLFIAERHLLCRSARSDRRPDVRTYRS